MKTKEFIQDVITRYRVNKQVVVMVDVYNTTRVIDILEHAYMLECALELTFKEFPDWLDETLDCMDERRWHEMYYLWLFRGELQYYCKSMHLSEAIRTVKEEYDL